MARLVFVAAPPVQAAKVLFIPFALLVFAAGRIRSLAMRLHSKKEKKKILHV